MSCARSFWPGSTGVPNSVSSSAHPPRAASTPVTPVTPVTAAAPVTHEPGDLGETCDMCGMAQVEWRKCKLVCRNCGTILKSCADL